MSATGRPGGLTVLAILNFILAALGLLGVLAVLGGSAALDLVPAPTEAQLSEMSEAERAESEKSQQEIAQARAILTDPMVRLFGALEALPALLLALAGIGYLRQRKGLGRGVGNLYAVVKLALEVGSMVLIQVDQPTPAITHVFGFLYPVLTLYLLNVTFRDDFHS
jgi:hypothetical protein